MRNLTPGEIAMLQPIFGNSINYGDVLVHPTGLFSPGLSVNGTVFINSGTAFTPENNQYRADFSKGTAEDKVLFVHEMTHVWQSQNGYWTAAVGAVFQGIKFATGSTVNPYRYDLSGNKSFSDYNMEAQAELISHYYSISKLDGKGMGAEKEAYATAHEAELKSVVGAFVNSDHSSSWTPPFDSVKDLLIAAENKIVAKIESIGNTLTAVEKSAYEAMGFIVYDPASINTTSYKNTNVITLMPNSTGTNIKYENFNTTGQKTSSTISAYSNTGDLIGRTTSQALPTDFIAVPNSASLSSVIETLHQTTTNNLGSATKALNVAGMVGLDKNNGADSTWLKTLNSPVNTVVNIRVNSRSSYSNYNMFGFGGSTFSWSSNS
ncbi:hypothetical protein, partial [Sulfuricurvum sp.]|uniref:hypothetical protein n=1 Tax=Sulfuricurvum sp. TaxID=2025608 RepID=UPI003BB7A5A3